MKEAAPRKELQEALPPIETHELQGEFWRVASAQAAKEIMGGTRPTEDIIRVNPDLGLFVLCDGMGGHADGRNAALLVSDAVDQHLSGVEQVADERDAIRQYAEEMVAAFRSAQTKLMDAWGGPQKDVDEGKMDTTATAVMLRRISDGRTVAIVGHVGNSRAYLVDKDRNVRQLTEDQDMLSTLEGSQLILDNPESDLVALAAHRQRVRDELANAPSVKELSSEARLFYNYRNITMSIGSTVMKVAVDVYPVPDGSRLVMMSDGVFESLGGKRTEQAVSMVPLQDTGVSAQQLVAEAQQNGHKPPKGVITAHPDDATAVVIELT